MAGSPTYLAQLRELVSTRSDDVSIEAKCYLLSVARGECKDSVGRIRARCAAYIELLDRTEGRPAATVSLKHSIEGGLVELGPAQSQDQRALPVPDGPAN